MPTTPICLTIVLLLDLLLEALPTCIIKYVVFLDSVLLLTTDTVLRVKSIHLLTSSSSFDP